MTSSESSFVNRGGVGFAANLHHSGTIHPGYSPSGGGPRSCAHNRGRGFFRTAAAAPADVCPTTPAAEKRTGAAQDRAGRAPSVSLASP